MARRPIRIIGNRTGAVAVEFALVVPVILFLFLGTFEATAVIRAKMKFANSAPILANLVSMQSPTAQGNLIADFCTGADYAMAPYPTANMAAQINSVTNTNGTASVDWTANCGSVSNPQSALTLAASLIPNSGDSVIVVQASYSYNTPIALVMPAVFNFTDVAFSRPRNGATVQYPP
jgi:Flp pilus assembly protein TadG